MLHMSFNSVIQGLLRDLKDAVATLSFYGFLHGSCVPLPTTCFGCDFTTATHLKITPESIDGEPPQKWQKRKGGLLSLLKDTCEPSSLDDPQQAASKEIYIYQCIDSDPEQKPLLWWKNYHTQFLILATEVTLYSGYFCSIWEGIQCCRTHYQIKMSLITSWTCKHACF